MYFVYIMSIYLRKNLQQTFENLPPPYTTYCTDYVNKWKENGGRGALTKKVKCLIKFIGFLTPIY